MVDEKGHRLMDLRLLDDMIIVQNEQRTLHLMRDIIEEVRQNHLQWRHLERRQRSGGEQRQRRLSDVILERLTGRDDRAPEAKRIVVESLQRDPCYYRKGALYATLDDPLSHKRCFAKASRCLKQHERAREAAIKSCQQMRAFHQQIWQTRRR